MNEPHAGPGHTGADHPDVVGCGAVTLSAFDTAPEDVGRRALEAHLRSPAFVSGAARGWWTVHRVRWPELLVSVAGGDTRVPLAFDLTGYPATAPTARPWDLDLDQPLDPQRWPRGPRADQVFRQDWSVSTNGALYVPFDRQARAGHDGWDSQYPGHVWHPNRSVRDYLLLVRDVLAHDGRAP